MKLCERKIDKIVIPVGLCKFFVAVFLCFLTIFCCNNAASAETLKVGYDISGIYLYKDMQGNYRGYDVEYLYEVAKYTDWQYEFVPFDSWAKAVNAVEQGDIDILPTVLKSPQREQSLLFSAQKMGDIYIAVIVPNQDGEHYYGDYEFLQDARIGMRYNTIDSAEFAAWAQQLGLQYRPVWFGDQQDLLTALEQGNIDAAALSYAGKARAYRAVAEFGPQGMYFAVNPARPDVLTKLNIAMRRTAIMNPAFVNRFAKDYLERGVNALPVFNTSEQAYIKQAQPIRVALSCSQAPFSSQDKGKGFTGILPELLDKISQISGLRFTFVSVNSQEEAIAAVQEGRADVVGRLADNIYFSASHNLRLTTAYSNMATVQLTRSQHGTIERIALQDGSLKDIINMRKPEGTELQIELFPCILTCVKALDAGQVDAVYCDSATAMYFMNTHRASDYQLNALPAYPYSLTLGVSKGADKNLAVILDKCIRYIGSNGMEDILTRNSVPQGLSVGALWDRIPRTYIVLAVIGLSILVLCLAYASFTLWRKRGVEQRMMLVREKNQKMKSDLTAVRKIEEAKDEFFSHISHDMRTPLNGIIGFTNLASQAGTAEEKQQHIEKIRISSSLLLDLINDTLQLSKMERGKYPLTWTGENSRGFFDKLVTPIRIIAEEKNIHFILDMERLQSCNIMVDRLNTQKVYMNILSNAIKFTPEGGTVTMTLETMPSTKDTFMLHAVICDTGIGISEEYLPKIYQPFSQEQRAGTSKMAGTGLGLSIVHRLLDLMGGTITIESEQNKGTTVTVDLAFDFADEKTVPILTADKTDTALTVLQGKKVLLCEDNELNAEIVKTMLESQGMTVVWVENGQMGVEAFLASEPEALTCILMDLRMPVMDGYEAVRQIRASEREDSQTIPIIALSADAFEEDIKRCKEHGMNGHVAKPISPSVLYAELVKYC